MEIKDAERRAYLEEKNNMRIAESEARRLEKQKKIEEVKRREE